MALYLHDHGFGALTRRSPPKLILTKEGMEKAEQILGQISDVEDRRTESDSNSWSDGQDEPLEDWLIVHGHRAFQLGEPFALDGMMNFREIANKHPRPPNDKQLETALSNMEFRDMIMQD